VPSVTVPIIDQLVHPSFGLLTRTATLGTFTGNGTLVPPQNPLIALTYGISWSFFTIPANIGLTLGDPIEYEFRQASQSISSGYRRRHCLTPVTARL